MRVSRILMGVAIFALASPPLLAQRMEGVPQAEPQQQTPATVTTGGLKVGVLDLEEAIGRTKDGQKASEELQGQFAPRNNELQKLAQEIQNIENQLRTQERTLSPEARAQLLRQVDQKRRLAQRLQEDIQEDFQMARNEHVAKIWTNMQKVIDQYAREKGYGIVINASVGANTSTIIYAAPAVDITEDVIRLYDQLYPIAAAQPAPPAGQQRPAAQTQRPSPPADKPPQR